MSSHVISSSYDFPKMQFQWIDLIECLPNWYRPATRTKKGALKMNSWKRMSKDVVRIFSTQNQHIAIVTGKRRSRCAEIELVEVTQTPRIPVLAIQCQCD